MILLSTPTDDAFKQCITVKQRDLIKLYSLDGVAGPNTLVQAAKARAHGPFSFISLTQPAAAGTARVNVIHAMKEYMLSTLMPPNIDNRLVGRVYAFAGELTISDGMIELPRCFKQPDHH